MIAEKLSTPVNLTRAGGALATAYTTGHIAPTLGLASDLIIGGAGGGFTGKVVRGAFDMAGRPELADKPLAPTPKWVLSPNTRAEVELGNKFETAKREV